MKKSIVSILLAAAVIAMDASTVSAQKNKKNLYIPLPWVCRPILSDTVFPRM